MPLDPAPKPVVLLIFDGWGIGPANAGNAITQANIPNFRKFSVSFPHTQLTASGEAVGLPRGEDGNTETGHLNIGAGKIVYQDLPRINMSIADGTFETNQVFLQAFDQVKRNNSKLHLMGLVGSGGVHSNINHLYALLSAAKKNGLSDNVILHLFTDGRDSPPTAGVSFITQIQQHIDSLHVGIIGSVMGRYYAMDRDRRWDRTQLAYDALTVGTDCTNRNPADIVQERYNAGETDEFIKPFSLCDANGKPHLVNDNDAVIFFNFRIDRPRQLTKAFVLPNFESGIVSEGFDPYAIKYEGSHIRPKGPTQTFQRKKIIKNLFFVTMTEYERGLPASIAFPPQTVDMPLGRVISEQNLHQLRMCETEKERFVTYYFNGQREDAFPNEDRIIIPSKKVATYDQAPEMSAYEITTTLIEKINTDMYALIVVNFANADMVGHTGNLQAGIKACEILDECLGKIVAAVNVKNGVVLVTADHGNAEEMINNETGEIDTEHSTYPVPLLIISNRYQNQGRMLPSGILADIAPTILSIMGISKPTSMTGRALI
ncbi:2,3-bisphosphoglycerate-independent phosphoglycerate mutase [Candidatus Cerribacteria bacterium 'Amazon FNV 2010 28 9']|uniref:2,3-bisphosphoglycerate-independent phosphoglycerate mutase n=1 Tax=Candidatus Cerribacteria bacterium 'Amazon FNV 2010 28 9' TaxID=2081795 RepID=A0A317JRJ7_9BACT|nr:MAG: 2,3-bisphosphoglycerate-independent phosphoglycerate mutase [Candidatus Cerribacteria bacterium 'Amazon FNV 2010 28 9']